MKLNLDFTENMRILLGEELPDYLASLDSPPTKGLRVNTLKISTENFLNTFDFPITPSGYTDNGFLLQSTELSIGTHPAHHAGLFYMQEPSATVAAAALIPRLGKRVLDLCAAPGGKSTQIACALPKDGVLVSNEINFSRARILQSNIERMGIKNALVTCNSPADFPALFPEYFDSVIVDAPCSGEGMFRKESAALRDWSQNTVDACARRQTEILDSASKTLKEGGFLLYSTCTLNTTENEKVIKDFLKNHDFETVPVHESLRKLCRPGYGLPDAIRLFPHTSYGEGHFVCLLQKKSSDNLEAKNYSMPYSPYKKNGAFDKIFNSLSKTSDFGALRKTGDIICAVPEQIPFIRGLNVLKAGVTLFTEQKDGRLEPHHNLVSSLRKGEAENCIDLPVDSPLIKSYLRGEAVSFDTEFSGYGVLCVEGYPLGLVKSTGGTLKNHYPKALRNY